MINSPSDKISTIFKLGLAFLVVKYIDLIVLYYYVHDFLHPE